MDFTQYTREQVSAIAQEHYAHCENDFSEEINHSVKNTIMYNEGSEFVLPEKKYPTTVVKLRMCGSQDSVNLLERTDEKIAVLNFSDYVKPGGLFLDGSKAQEECLCHHSILANILEEFRYTFYVRNKQDGLLYGMYKNRMLYSKDVLFFCPKGDRKVDVITCAAPNFTSGYRYGSVSRETANNTIKDRLEYIFKAAIHNGVDVLVLGAYGCGVFKNDPEVVAQAIMEWAEKYEGYFSKIIIPIPGDPYRWDNKNYNAFRKHVYGHRLSDRS